MTDNWKIQWTERTAYTSYSFVVSIRVIPDVVRNLKLAVGREGDVIYEKWVIV